MGKIIRPTYPVEFSIGLLLLIFVLSSFLSSQIFVVSWRELSNGTDVYIGMFLVGCAVVIMLLILWEEFLFPVKIKPIESEVVFRNHRTKLKSQLLIYCIIPAIFAFIYIKYEINLVRFIIWATICITVPIVGKIISGIKNYNDFLKLTKNSISYKNNDQEGTFDVKDIQQITLIKDARNVLHKVQLSLTNNSQVTIDLDEMELEAYYQSINKFILVYYKGLVNEPVLPQA